MCNEKIEIHVAANAVRPRTDASVLSNHSVLQEGYQLCSVSLPGGDGPAFQLCGVQTTLPRAGMRHIPPRSPDLWQESEVRPLAGDWMLLW